MSPERPRPGGGALVLVVGPSGAGKDTIMRQARERLGREAGVVFARRIVTRAADASEDNETMAEEVFAQAAERGEFALAWQAHGLCYGVTHGALEARERGLAVVLNGSRSVVTLARERFARVRVVLVTAPDAVLRARILARGRDLDAEARLGRESRPVEELRPDLVIDNVGSVREGVDRFVGYLLQEAAETRALTPEPAPR